MYRNLIIFICFKIGFMFLFRKILNHAIKRQKEINVNSRSI